MRVHKKSILLILNLLVTLCIAFFIYHIMTNQVNDKRFNKTIQGMEMMVEQVKKGDINEGKEVFNEVHDFFHDLDPLLREKDNVLAERLWINVLQIETQFGVYKPNPQKLIDYGAETILLLKDAKREMD